MTDIEMRIIKAMVERDKRRKEQIKRLIKDYEEVEKAFEDYKKQVANNTKND